MFLPSVMSFDYYLQHVTGTRCSTDFAEVPSTLMEYFSSDPRVLMSVGRHYKTGEPMPQGEVDQFCAAKRIFSGVDIQSQLFYSMLDQQYHGLHPLRGSTTEILKQVRIRSALISRAELCLVLCILTNFGVVVRKGVGFLNPKLRQNSTNVTS